MQHHTFIYNYQAIANSSVFNTIEDEANLSRTKIVSIFGKAAKQISELFFEIKSKSGISYDSHFTNTLKDDSSAIENYIKTVTKGTSTIEAANLHMREASNEAQLYIQNTNFKNLDVDDYIKSQNKLYVTQLAQEKTLGNAKKLINEYNSSLKENANGLTDCGLTQEDFVNSVAKSNSTLGNYLSGLDGAEASLTKYVSSLIASKLATIGLKIATTALNAVVGMGIGLIVSWLMSGVSAIIENIKENCKSLTEKISDANTKLKEISDSAQKSAKDFQNLKKSIDDVMPRFAELAKGVNALGENESLSDEEYSEFLSLQNQIAELFPDIDIGLDNDGNHMLALSYSANTLTESLENLLEVARQNANVEIADGMKDTLDTVGKLEDSYEEQIAKLEKEKELHKSVVFVRNILIFRVKKPII